MKVQLGKFLGRSFKAILKGEAMAQDVRHLLSDAGRVMPARLQELYHEERLGELPPVMAAAMTASMWKRPGKRGSLSRTSPATVPRIWPIMSSLPCTMSIKKSLSTAVLL